MSEEPVLESPPYGSVGVTYSVADIGALMLNSWYVWLIAPALVMVMLLAIQLGFPMQDGASLREAFETVDWRVIGFFGILIFLVRLVTLAIRHAWQRLRRRPDVIQFQLLEDGPHFVSDGITGTIYWKRIKKFRSTDDRLFYYISRGSALIVPRRAFADDERFEAWRIFSEQRWVESRGTK